MNETSVYQLISRLCANLIKESDDSCEGFSLNCAKSIAFQVLLKNDIKESCNLEQLMFELQFASFELLLANRHKDSKQLNQFVEQVKENPDGVESISTLLLHLKNIDPDPENVKRQVKKSVINSSKFYQ